MITIDDNPTIDPDCGCNFASFQAANIVFNCGPRNCTLGCLQFGTLQSGTNRIISDRNSLLRRSPHSLDGTKRTHCGDTDRKSI